MIPPEPSVQEFAFEDIGDGGNVNIRIWRMDDRICIAVDGEVVGGSQGAWSATKVRTLCSDLQKAIQFANQPNGHQSLAPIGDLDESGPNDLMAWTGASPGSVFLHVMAGGGDSELTLRPTDAQGLLVALQRLADAA